MYIMNATSDGVINSEFVERFLVVDKDDASLLIASYSHDRPPVTIARYKDAKEARDVLADLFQALYGGQSGYTLPDSKLLYEQHIKKDARTKRRGGS